MPGFHRAAFGSNPCVPEVVDLRTHPELLAPALRLNNAHVPMVNRLRVAELRALVDQAIVAAVILDHGQVAALMIALPAHARYRSLNFRWLARRYRRFVYVDRIAVAAGHRGGGLARALYATVIAAAGPLPVACEVNLMPPNPGSLAFHRRLGFRPAGRAWNPQARKQVVFLVRRPDLAAAR
jgi:hypothetical protein